MKRILSMSGTVLPTRFKMLLDRFGDDPAAMKQAGVAYAVSQIIDLVANGIHAIHIYSCLLYTSKTVFFYPIPKKSGDFGQQRINLPFYAQNLPIFWVLDKKTLFYTQKFHLYPI